MKIFSLLILFIIFLACSQNQQPKKHIPDPKAKQLYDSAAKNTLKSEDAIALLDRAIQIDRNYYGAYKRKLRYQITLRRFDDALITAKNVVRLGPDNPDNYTTMGVLLDKKGDTITARGYYRKAIKKIDRILDTMSKRNFDYDFLLMTKGVNLVLLGEQEKANRIWKSQQGTDPETIVFSNSMGKSRRQLLDTYFFADTTTVDAYSAPTVEIKTDH